MADSFDLVRHPVHRAKALLGLEYEPTISEKISRGKDLPAVTGNRQALLNLPLEEYKRYEEQVEHGFVQAAKFLHMQHIYRMFDLPYQSQIAAILADIGDACSRLFSHTRETLLGLQLTAATNSHR